MLQKYCSVRDPWIEIISRTTNSNPNAAVSEYRGYATRKIRTAIRTGKVVEYSFVVDY